jgi:D-tyrosyl-tRNA(Tyr) deacylase
MKALIQRVQGRTEIQVKKDQKETSDFFEGVGLVVLLGWVESDLKHKDLEKAEEWILSRILGLRIFEDQDGKMNLSLKDYAQANKINSGILWVSQFTLGAELESGFRPSFTKAMSPDLAKKRYESFCEKIKKTSNHQNIFGQFSANMSLSFTNWGPVTLLLER